MDNKKEMEIMTRFSIYIQAAISKSANETGGNKDKLLLMHSAVLLKAAVELYTTAFDDDDTVEHILHSAIQSIPYVRGRPNSKKNPSIKSETLH